MQLNHTSVTDFFLFVCQKADLAVASLASTFDRRKVIDFADSMEYLETSVVLYKKSGYDEYVMTMYYRVCEGKFGTTTLFSFMFVALYTLFICAQNTYEPLYTIESQS